MPPPRNRSLSYMRTAIRQLARKGISLVACKVELKKGMHILFRTTWIKTAYTNSSKLTNPSIKRVRGPNIIITDPLTALACSSSIKPQLISTKKTILAITFIMLNFKSRLLMKETSRLSMKCLGHGQPALKVSARSKTSGSPLKTKGFSSSSTQL